MKLPDIMRSKGALLLITFVMTLLVSGVALYLQDLERSSRGDGGLAVGDRPEGIPTPLDPDAFLRNLSLTRTPPPGPAHPARLQIESVGIDILVLTVSIDPDGFLDTPVRFAGYWGLSAALGTAGNIVIVGHNHTTPRPVFLNLSQVQAGDTIVLTDQFNKEHRYRVDATVTLKAEDASPEEANIPAQYVQPTDHEQVTLLTCYPQASCAARFIVVATPAQ